MELKKMGLMNTEKIIEKDLSNFNEYIDMSNNQTRNALKNADVNIFIRLK